MKKFILVCLFLFLFFSQGFDESTAATLTTPKKQSDNFEISTHVVYTVHDSGFTEAAFAISIKNKTNFIYAPFYIIDTSDDVKNLKVVNSNGAIPNTLKKNKDGGSSIEIKFEKGVVGEGKLNEFAVTYDSSEIAKKVGNIWEVNIPGLSNPDDFENYLITLKLPQSFGRPSIIKPQKKLNAVANEYSFSKEDIGKSGIFMLFGDSQFFKFKLAYHLANSNLFPTKTEIALPPSTNYQEVLIQAIIPSPTNVMRDVDGNWLAQYVLPVHEKKDVEVTGIVKLVSTPHEQTLSGVQKTLYLAELPYWEGSSEVKKIAKTLKTSESIYDYVVNQLSYNYKKVEDRNVRLGAKDALLTPTNSVCLEFTDLFVALSRAAGIPARSLEGFAYSQNNKLRPLSLVKDVLHTWPEYYDENKKTWIMVDPTWANTSSGVDYFNTFDFSHIAFVVKGASSTYPIPAGGYKVTANSKDVDVTFADSSEFKPTVKSQASLSFPTFSFSILPIEGSVTITNTGTAPLSSQELLIQSELFPSGKKFIINEIPPYGHRVLPISFGKVPLLTNKSYELTILYAGSTIKKTIRVGVIPESMIPIIGGGIGAAGIFVLFVAFKTRSLFIQKRE